MPKYYLTDQDGREWPTDESSYHQAYATAYAARVMLTKTENGWVVYGRSDGGRNPRDVLYVKGRVENA